MTDFLSLPVTAVPGAAPQQPKSGKQPENIPKNNALRLAAEQLEAGFLSEMLKAAGLGKAREAFGGGAGEDQFASFLRQTQAEEMVRSGGIGLAETLYQALKEKENVK